MDLTAILFVLIVIVIIVISFKLLRKVVSFLITMGVLIVAIILFLNFF